nr:hypothetical protein [uncultured Cohaesibacter sp.]
MVHKRQVWLQAFAFGLALIAQITLGEQASAGYTNATLYLIKQQIKEGCDGGSGTFDFKGVYEVDLDGDGHLDLVLSHQGLSCDREMPMSSLCGAQFCSILIYYREGRLLKKRDEILGYILSYSRKPEPLFDIAQMDGSVSQWRPRRDPQPQKIAQ